MKKQKKYIFITGILIVIIGVFGMSLILEKRDPKKILVRYSRNHFNISLKSVIDSIDITYFNEQWCGNGDGECMIRFKYKVNEDFFRNFHRLPIEESLYPITDPYSAHGYFRYDEDKNDSRNYGVLYFNTDSLTGILYYRVM